MGSWEGKRGEEGGVEVEVRRNGEVEAKGDRAVRISGRREFFVGEGSVCRGVVSWGDLRCFFFSVGVEGGFEGKWGGRECEMGELRTSDEVLARVKALGLCLDDVVVTGVSIGLPRTEKSGRGDEFCSPEDFGRIFQGGNEMSFVME